MTDSASGPTERILAPAGPAAAAADLERQRTGRAPRYDDPHDPARRRPPARAGVPGQRHAGCRRRLPPRRRASAAAAAARRCRGGRGRGVAPAGRWGTVAGASEAALRALTKLDQVLPSRLRHRVHGIHGSISIAARRAACRDRRRRRPGRDRRRLPRPGPTGVRVRRPLGATSQRRVEPYGLVATGRRWYLMAYDLDREDWRTFRLDRLREVRVSTWRFTAREHEDPVTYVHRAVTSAPYPHQVLVRFHAAAEAVRAVYPVAAVSVEPETDDDLPAAHRRRGPRHGRGLPRLGRARLRGARAARAC